jgi:hypothetical protein
VYIFQKYPLDTWKQKINHIRYCVIIAYSVLFICRLSAIRLLASQIAAELLFKSPMLKEGCSLSAFKQSLHLEKILLDMTDCCLEVREILCCMLYFISCSKWGLHTNVNNMISETKILDFVQNFCDSAVMFFGHYQLSKSLNSNIIKIMMLQKLVLSPPSSKT